MQTLLGIPSDVSDRLIAVIDEAAPVVDAIRNAVRAAPHKHMAAELVSDAGGRLSLLLLAVG